MAAQNEPNFVLFTSSHLDFLTDKIFTELDFLTEETNFGINGFACVVDVLRERVMKYIRCKIDFEN